MTNVDLLGRNVRFEEHSFRENVCHPPAVLRTQKKKKKKKKKSLQERTGAKGAKGQWCDDLLMKILEVP